MSPRHAAPSGRGWSEDNQQRRVAANIMNKQSRTVDKGWSSNLKVGHGANNLHRKKFLW
jgi:hypothetical protein